MKQSNQTRRIEMRIDATAADYLERVAKLAGTDIGTVAAVVLARGYLVDKARMGEAPQRQQAQAQPRAMLTIDEAAAALGVHATAIMRALHNGKLTRHPGKHARSVLIDSREVEAARKWLKPRKKRTAKKVTRRTKGTRHGR